MITLEQQNQLATLTVLGEFTLADFKEFEQMLHAALVPGAAMNLLFDLREMAGFTVDMVLEEIRFSRAHPDDFRRIAVLTHSPWVAWTTWLERAFVAADLRSFSDEEDARAWLAQ